MTNSMTRAMEILLRLLVAALLALAPGIATAQDGQFDLRTRGSPSPEPTVVGPVDPDTPTVRARPRALPPIVLPTAQPVPTATASVPTASPTQPTATPRIQPTRMQPQTPPASQRPGADRPAQPVGEGALALPPATSTPATATAALPAALPKAYQPRNLDLVSRSGGIGLWLGLATLALLLIGGAWLAWSRHFRHRARALPAPEVERPRVAARSQTPALAPEPLPSAAGALHLALQATRMSATLVNTTLSYRLAVTNRGLEALHDIRIAGDMIAAHASRSATEQLGPAEASLPELHRIATLAPGESVTLGGDIRLPLVSITPIRRGDAALFVPLARLRGHAQDPAGATVVGGGTFLVGQEPGASKRLQPFRLDLGPRNYSKLGQQLLPAA